MTSTANSLVQTATGAPIDVRRQPVLHRSTTETHRRWAVVEIRPDGTVGPWTLTTAPGAGEAIRSVSTDVTPGNTGVDPTLQVHLGRLQASQGRHRDAVKTLTKALARAGSAAQQHRCLAELALVEAYMGRLNSSREHEAQAERVHPGTVSESLALARGWRLLAQGESTGAQQCLDLVEPTLDRHDDPWSGTIRALLTADLLMAAGRPDSASSALAHAVPDREEASSAWSAGVLLAARADALLAEGEGHRALALLTPLPGCAAAEAGVVVADARATIGDMRGAHAALTAIVDLIDLAPTAVQVRAWILEARTEEHRGDHRRSRRLVERALLASTTEGMRTPLRRDCRWLRATADRDLPLLHAHRELLTSVAELAQTRKEPPGRTPPSSAAPDVLGASLTQRESEVLELLAEMYSTEEIAAALFVSGNTVKTHLKGIFAKLRVNRRVDAVRRGRQLGLC